METATPLTTEQEELLLEMWKDNHIVRTIEELERDDDNYTGLTQAQLDAFWREVLRGDVRCETCAVRTEDEGRCEDCIIDSLDDKAWEGDL